MTAPTAGMAPAAMPFQPTTDELADLGFHYGLPVFAWGEDGDVATLGHVPARSAIAAANRAWRTAWGERLRPFPHAPLPKVAWVWALFTRDRVHDCEESWEVPEGTPAAVAITVVCGQEGIFEAAVAHLNTGGTSRAA